jgi:hypothetical protein
MAPAPELPDNTMRHAERIRELLRTIADARRELADLTGTQVSSAGASGTEVSDTEVSGTETDANVSNNHIDGLNPHLKMTAQLGRDGDLFVLRSRVRRMRCWSRTMML